MVTIVIADDERVIRLLVNRSIVSRDHRFVEATDGDEAWRVIQEEKPDLVLMDVRMPGLTGIEVVRLLRADPALSHAKVVLLTAESQAYEIEDGFAAGADEYITKPFSPTFLNELVERLLAS